MRTILIGLMALAFAASTTQAGWFGKKEKHHADEPVVNVRVKDRIVQPVLIDVKMVTNTWEEAVRLADDGLIECVGTTSVKNYLLMNSFSSTNTICVPDVYYTDLAIRVECQEDHVSDWPKTSTDVRGIQRVRFYELLVGAEGDSKTLRWKKYLYPHTKITLTRTTKIVFETDQKEDVQEWVCDPGPKCDKCGK